MDAAFYSSLLVLAANFYTGQNIDIPMKVQNSKSRLMFLLFKAFNSPGKKKKVTLLIRKDHRSHGF